MLCNLTIYIWSRPINISQRVSLATFTAMIRCEMVQQTPHLLTRCSDAQTKVLATDTETALDMARLKSLMPLEEKMVSWDQVHGWFRLAMTSVQMGMRSMGCTVVAAFCMLQLCSCSYFPNQSILCIGLCKKETCRVFHRDSIQR